MSFTYKGLSATLDRHIITSEEIDRQMQRLLQQSPRIAVITDRPTESGDEVVLDYAGYCDGVQFPGGTAEMQEVTVHVTFPEAYHAADLAGKKAEFRCKIHEIRVKTSYDLDDTFAKEVGGCDTLDEMRAKLGESLQAYSDERGEMDLQDRLLRMAADTLEFNPSESQINAELDNQMDNLSAQLAQQGLNLDMYCQFLSTTKEKLREDARANALQSIRCQAAIEQIVDLEGLEASKEEIGEAVALICRQNNMTLEQLKPYYDAQFEAAVIRSVLTSKVMKLIRDAANITQTA